MFTASKYMDLNKKMARMRKLRPRFDVGKKICTYHYALKPPSLLTHRQFFWVNFVLKLSRAYVSIVSYDGRTV